MISSCHAVREASVTAMSPGNRLHSPLSTEVTNALFKQVAHYWQISEEQVHREKSNWLIHHFRHGMEAFSIHSRGYGLNDKLY